jgi:hypothetical protein
MYSASEIQKPDQIFVVQSDSSGTDGFGYHFSLLEDLNSNQQFVSRRWLSSMFIECNQITEEFSKAENLFSPSPSSSSKNLVIPSDTILVTPQNFRNFSKNLFFHSPMLENENSVVNINQPVGFSGNSSKKVRFSGISELSADAKIFQPQIRKTPLDHQLEDPGQNSINSSQLPQSSIWGEIYALKDFLETTEQKDKILLWISDSLNAVYDINKGRCGSEEDAELLRKIFYYCDIKKLQLIAIWVPRELNNMADYLSHLSYISDRDSVSGNVADLDGANQSG